MTKLMCTNARKTKKYYLTDNGNVLEETIKNGNIRVLKPILLNRYLYIQLPIMDGTGTNKKRWKMYSIHRLVGQFFLENKNPKEFTEVHHINANKLDNRAVNLQWVSKQYNVREAMTRKANNKKHCKNKVSDVRKEDDNFIV